MDTDDELPSGSYLVRVWHEPRSDSETTSMRISLRDLRSGELRYFRAAEEVAGHLERDVQTASERTRRETQSAG